MITTFHHTRMLCVSAFSSIFLLMLSNCSAGTPMREQKQISTKQKENETPKSLENAEDATPATDRPVATNSAVEQTPANAEPVAAKVEDSPANLEPAIDENQVVMPIEPQLNGCYIDLQMCPSNVHIAHPAITLGKLFRDDHNSASSDSEACKRRAHEYAIWCKVMYPRSVTAMFYRNGDRTMIQAGHHPGCYGRITGCAPFDALNHPMQDGWALDQAYDGSLQTGLRRDKCYERKAEIIEWCQAGGSANPSVEIGHVNNWGGLDGEW